MHTFLPATRAPEGLNFAIAQDKLLLFSPPTRLHNRLLCATALGFGCQRAASWKQKAASLVAIAFHLRWPCLTAQREGWWAP
jgi:hypothetical protein